jgi:glycosyltransferase involved in cell wall biosynthesis
MGPRLSVVMPVRNALPHLEEAIASIVAQTFPDFEFVILDDASTDGSTDVLRSWAERDPRIRLVEAAERLGPAGSSNRAVAEARAPVVARMDADDVARSDRLERQLALFDEQPDAVLVGSLWEAIDQDGRPVRPADRARLLRPSPFAPFCHPTIMFRKEVFEAIGGYRAEANRWEDIDLYLRFAAVGRVLVVTEPLVSVRQSDVSTRLRDGREGFEEAMDLMYRCLAEHRTGRDYRPLLARAREARAGRLVPPSFITSGAPFVWAARRPAALRRLVRRGRLGVDSGSAAALAWAAWADASPRTLRLFLRTFLKLRNRAAERALAGRPWIEWVPPSA